MFINLLRLRSLFAALILLSFVIGCGKKNDDPSPTTATTSAAVGNWKFSAITVSPAQAGITDYLAFVVAFSGSTCLTDVTLMFKSDGTIASDNPKSCQSQSTSVSDATSITSGSKWSLNNGKMTLTASDGTVTVYDATISGNTMSLSNKEDDVDPTTGKTQTYTFTLQLRKV